MRKMKLFGKQTEVCMWQGGWGGGGEGVCVRTRVCPPAHTSAHTGQG